MKNRLLIILFGIVFLIMIFIFIPKSYATQNKTYLTFYGKETFMSLKGMEETDFYNDSTIQEKLKNYYGNFPIESGSVYFYKSLKLYIDGTETSYGDIVVEQIYENNTISDIKISINKTTGECNIYYYATIKSDFTLVINISKEFTIDTEFLYNKAYYKVGKSVRGDFSNANTSSTNLSIDTYFKDFTYNLLEITDNKDSNNTTEKDNSQSNLETENSNLTNMSNDTITTSTGVTSEYGNKDVLLGNDVINASYNKLLDDDEIIEELDIDNDFKIEKIDILDYKENYNKIGNYDCSINLIYNSKSYDISFIIKVLDNIKPDIICSHLVVENNNSLINIDTIKTYISVYDEYDGKIDTFSVEDIDNYSTNYNKDGIYRFYISAYDNALNFSNAVFYLYVGNINISNEVYKTNSLIKIINANEINENNIVNYLKDYYLIPLDVDVCIEYIDGSYIIEYDYLGNNYKYNVDILNKEINVLEDTNEKNDDNSNAILITIISICSFLIILVIVILSIKIHKKRS